jgi:hypothetical protein
MAEQTTPRRYCVFAGNDYYPAGGWHDFRLSRDTLEQAVAAAEELMEELQLSWWQIFDLDQRRIVAQSQYQGYGAPNAFPDLNN